MTKYLTLKQNLKEIAETIRKAKVDCKQFQRDHHGCDGAWEGDPRNGGKWVGNHYSIISKLKHEFRHKHIAICLLRGVPRDVIEHPAENNKPDENLIKEIYDAYIEKDVCVSAS